METISHYINGIRIDDNLCSVQQGSTLLATISPTRTVTTVPGRHGSVSNGMPPSFPERSVSIKCKTFGAAYRSDMERLARLCTAPNVTLGRSFDGSMQVAQAELTSFEADDSGVYNGIAAPFTAVFALPGVWWRDPTTLDRTIPANATGVLWPSARQWSQRYWTRWQDAENDSPSLLADFVTMWLGEANASPSLLIPLADGIPDGMFGDAPITDAIIRCPKGVTSVSVSDPVTGTGVTWQGTANSSAYTFLDAGNARAWQAASDSQWSPAGTDVTGGLDYPAAGMLQCWPDPVSNAYRLTSKITGSTESLLAHVRRAWW